MVSKWVWQWCKPPHCKARYLFQVPKRLTNYQPQYVRHWLTLVTEHTTAHTGLASLLMPSFSIVSLCSGMAYVRQAWLRVTKDCKIFCNVYLHICLMRKISQIVFVCLLTVLYFCWKRVNLMIEMGLFQNPVRFSLLHILMLYVLWVDYELMLNALNVCLIIVCVFFFLQICVFLFLSSAEKGSSLMVDDSQSFPTTTMPRTTVGQCVTWNCTNCFGRSQENLI